MTTQGFPDWQTNVPAIGYTALALTNPVAPATVIYGPFYVGGYEDTILHFRPVVGVGGFLVNLAWFTDATLTQTVGSASATTYAGNEITQKFANLGAYLEVTVITAGAAIGQPFEIEVQPRKTLSNQDPAFQAGVMLNYAPNVAAGATVTVGLSTVGARRIRMTWTTAAALFVMQLLSIDTGGLVQGTVFTADQTTVGVRGSAVISLPATSIYLKLTNNDGVLRAFTVTITPDF